MGKGSQNKIDELTESASPDVGFTTSTSLLNKVANYDWEEIRKHNKKDDMWIVVNQTVYDVTGFRNKHPGGPKLLDHYAGSDATDAFNAFHKEFDRVNKQAKFLKIGHLNPSSFLASAKHTAEIKKDFEELKKLAVKMNLFTPSYFFYFLHGFHIIFSYIMGYVILWNYSHTWLGILLSLVCSIIAQFQAGWTQHDYGHSSFFAKTRHNRLLHGLFAGVIKGSSPEWWRMIHNQHHGKPNVINQDPDVRMDPLFVLGTSLPKRVRVGLFLRTIVSL